MPHAAFTAPVYDGGHKAEGDAGAPAQRAGKASGNMFGRMKWYAARLAAMSPAEIAHRVKEAGHRARLSRERRGWRAFATADAPFPDLADLRKRIADAAACACDPRGAPNMLGHMWPPGGALAGVAAQDWFRDPVSGRMWPGAEAGAFDIDVRSTAHDASGARYGDVKFVWEPNRLQAVQVLAARIADGRAADLTAALALIESWMDANPPYRGVNWMSGIEIALRMISLTMLVAAASPSAFGTPERARLRSFILAHAGFLAAMPSLYSSANNHRVAEGLGLYLAGVLAPDLDGTQGWSAEGRAILERETALQIYMDGVGAEQSPTYQAFTMELVAFGALVARGRGAPFSAALEGRLAAGARFLIALQNENGQVPAIGDDDEGRAITDPWRREPLYVASVAASVQALSGDRGGIAPGYLREAMFGARRRGHAEVPDTIRRFRDGGYSVVSKSINGRRTHLVFDHGPLGYLSLAAHGHADALSIWLSVDGAPVFVDAGTFLYHSGGRVRARLRESLAHNTLAIAGRSQSEVSAAFSWKTKASARDDRAGESADDVLSGSHDGYRRAFGVTHRRDIRMDREGYVVEDRLVGTRERRPVEIGFLCDSSIGVAHDGADLVLSRGAAPILRLTPPQGFEARIVRADMNTGRGLVSPRFGLLAESAHIVLSGMSAGDAMTTRISFIPAHGGEGA